MDGHRSGDQTIQCPLNVERNGRVALFITTDDELGFALVTRIESVYVVSRTSHTIRANAFDRLGGRLWPGF